MTYAGPRASNMRGVRNVNPSRCVTGSGNENLSVVREQPIDDYARGIRAWGTFHDRNGIEIDEVRREVDEINGQSRALTLNDHIPVAIVS